MNGYLGVKTTSDGDFKLYYVVLQESELLWFDKPMGKLKGSANLSQCFVSLTEILDTSVAIAIEAKEKSKNSSKYEISINDVENGKLWLKMLQAAATSDSSGMEWVRSGWLTKKGKKRWFLLAGGELLWFGKEMESTTSVSQLESKMKGRLEIGGHCSVSLYDAKKNGFVITSTNPDAQYVLYAANEYEMQEWLSALNEVIAADTSANDRPHELKAWLSVKGNKRYFMIVQHDDRASYMLRWYATTRGRTTVTKDDKCKGMLELEQCNVNKLKGKKPGFAVETSDGRSYEVTCKSDAQVDQWHASLQYCIAVSGRTAQHESLDDSLDAAAPDAAAAALDQTDEAAAAAAAATTAGAQDGAQDGARPGSRRGTADDRRRASSAVERQFKRGWLLKNSRRRFAVLEADGVFAWYVDEAASSERSKAKQALKMGECVVSASVSDRFSFTVSHETSSKTWTLTAASVAEAEEWLSTLRASRKYARRDRRASSVAPVVIEDQRRGTCSSGPRRAMSRAATMEMKRRMTHSLGAALFPERAGAIYEQFLVVGLPPNVRIRKPDDAKQVRAPQVLYRYPPDQPLATEQQVAGFCFPSGVSIRLLQRTQSASARNEILYGSLEKLEESESSFVILITGSENLVYGICVMKHELLNKRPSFLPADAFPEEGAVSRTPFDPVAPRCFVFLSRFPFFQLHFEVLYGLLARERLYGITRDMILGPDGEAAAPPSSEKEVQDASSEAGSEIQRMLQAYGSLEVPPDGEPLSFQLPQELRSLQFRCPPGDEDNLVANACLGALFKLVSLDDTLSLLGAITLEKQVVVVAENLGVLSAVVLALIPLMRPAVWQGAFIPIVPDALADALHCPVPFIMGVPQLDDDLRSMLDVIVLDVDKQQLSLPSFAIPPTPRRQTLVQSIEADYGKLYARDDAARRKAMVHPFKNSMAELELVNRVWEALKQYSVHLLDTVKANIMLMKAQPENEGKEFDFAEPEPVKQLLQMVAEEEYRLFFAEYCVTQNFLIALEKDKKKR